MRKTLQTMVAAALIMVGGTVTGMARRPARAQAEDATWSVAELPGAGDVAARLAGYYRPVEVEIAAQAPSYELPLDLGAITNAEVLERLLGESSEAGPLGAPARRMLQANGFAALDLAADDDIVDFYKQLQQRGIPIFITSDSLLHLYHIQFGETLRDIEERHFYDDMKAITTALHERALRLHDATEGPLQEAARLLVGYTAVPLILLNQVDYYEEAAALLEELRQAERLAPDRLAALDEAFLPAIAPAGQRPENVMFDTRALRRALESYLARHEPTDDPAAGAPDYVADAVRTELEQIAAHAGFGRSALFGYEDDYSQYVPRGHYTRSKVLQQYFKAMMWYGRMTFPLPKPDEKPDDAGAARWRQLQAASILAGMMDTPTADGRTVAEIWDRLYAVTAYYVGLADDLTPYEYRAGLRAVFGETVTGAELRAGANLAALRDHLAALRRPEIYGGTGNLEGPPAAGADEDILAAALAETQGLRLMGQRYVPDSYVMGRLVYPTVGLYKGEQPSVFTLVHTDGGPVRAFPRGLDVWAAFGSERARAWLALLGDDQYERYHEKLAALEEEFAAVAQADWNRNMYWSWLYALKALNEPYGEGYPTFMQTGAWRDKQLSAVLASWAQLRHDTILYAKQSYTMRVTAMPPAPRMVEGYVEPVPQFYARLVALTRMTLEGLNDFGLLDTAAEERLQSLHGIVSWLLDISLRELANERLGAEDYRFIRDFGERLQAAVAGLSEGTETTIVADVHTDTNSGAVLEQGTGYLHPMIVVYPMPDGGLVAGVGPVLSHYEFKQPMQDRLTNEAWRELLDSPQAPPLPPWAGNFTATAD